MIALTSKYDAAEPLPAVMLLVAPIVPVTLAPVLVTTSVVLPFAVISTLPSITGILKIRNVAPYNSGIGIDDQENCEYVISNDTISLLLHRVS